MYSCLIPWLNGTINGTEPPLLFASHVSASGATHCFLAIKQLKFPRSVRFWILHFTDVQCTIRKQLLPLK